jgi:hypothetical protein
MENAEVGRLYQLRLDVSLPGKGQIAIAATATGGFVVENARLELSAADPACTWAVGFVPTSTKLEVRLTPAQDTSWGCALTLEGVTIEATAHHLGSDPNAWPLERSDAAADPRLRRAAALASWMKPSEPETLLKFLWEESALTQSLRAGTYYPYKKRPANWQLLDQGLAAIYAFRVTGDPRFIEWIAWITEQVARYRDSETGALDAYRRRSYRSWGARVKSIRDGGTHWVAEVCTGACMVLPAALAIWEARQSERVPSALKARLDALLPVCEAVAEAFDDDIVTTAEGTSYLVMPHDGSPEPLAHAAPYAALLITLYAVTGAANRLTRAQQLAAYFHASISDTKSGNWSWPYRPTPEAMHGSGERFYKARVTLTFPIVAHGLELLFDASDMARFARAIDEFVLKDDGFIYLSVDPDAQRIDSSAVSEYTKSARLRRLSRLLSFWFLAPWRPALARKLENVLQIYPEIFNTRMLTSLPTADVYALRLDPERAMRAKTCPVPVAPQEDPTGIPHTDALALVDDFTPASPTTDRDRPAANRELKRAARTRLNAPSRLLSPLLLTLRRSKPSPPLSIQFPPMPVAETGLPARPRQGAGLSYRGSFDWTIWDQRQLPIMESYWLDFVKLFQSLLPARLRRDPDNYCGINLGTFNGAFQKAWMRLGYHMYGIELADVVDELHKYGCAGERDSFFRLSHVESASYDFAVMDRCLFNKPRNAFNYDRAVARYTERVSKVDRSKNWRAGPPYFRQVFRVLKTDGVFLAVLYKYWPEQAIRELYAEGEATLVVAKSNQPYLCVVVDRSKPATAFPTVEVTARALRGGAADALAKAKNDRTIGKIAAQSDGTVKFHHLPTNRLVVLNPRTGEVTADLLVLNDASASGFWSAEPELRRVIGRNTDSTSVVVLDRTITGRKFQIFETIASRSTSLLCGDLARGSLSLSTIGPKLLEAAGQIRDARVVVDVGEFDVQIMERNLKPRVDVKHAEAMLTELVAKLDAAGARTAILLPPACAVVTDRGGTQTDTVEAYRKMLQRIAGGRSVDLLDWCEPVQADSSVTYKMAVQQRADRVVEAIAAYLTSAAS